MQQTNKAAGKILGSNILLLQKPVKNDAKQAFPPTSSGSIKNMLEHSMSDLEIHSNSASCVPVVGTSDLGASPMMSPRLVTKWLVVLLLADAVCCGTRFLSAQQPKSSQKAAGASASPVAVDALGETLPANALLRFGTLRFRPPSGVSELALSPDESVIVSVGKNLIVWDTKTGQERWRAEADQFGRESQGSRYGARPIAFSSDKSQFFTTNGPGEIVIWNIDSQNREIVTIQSKVNDDAATRPHNTLSLDVTLDGTTFALGRESGIVVVRRDGTVLFEIANDIVAPLKNDERDRLAFFGHYTSARFSPDGTKIAVVTSDRPETLRIHATESGVELRSIPLVSKTGATGVLSRWEADCRDRARQCRTFIRCRIGRTNLVSRRSTGQSLRELYVGCRIQSGRERDRCGSNGSFVASLRCAYGRGSRTIDGHPLVSLDTGIHFGQQDALFRRLGRDNPSLGR